MAQHIIMAVGIDADAGVYKLVYDDAASTLTQGSYLSNTSIAVGFVAYLVAQSPLDNQWYVAGDYSGGKARIYKLDSDLAVDATWGGGSGYSEFTCDMSSPISTYKPTIYIGVNGDILISCADASNTNPVNLIDKDGTLLWQGKAYDSLGNRDVTNVRGGVILPNGNVCVGGSVDAGEKAFCAMSRLTGGYVD